MKLNYQKSVALCAFAFVLCSASVWAHEVSPGQSLGASSVSNVDVYTISCLTDTGLIPHRLVGSVQKIDGATNSMRVSIGRASAVGAGASATTTNAVGSRSAWAQVAATNGSTHVAVIGHSSAFLNHYTAFFNCEMPSVGALPPPDYPPIETGTTISGGLSAGRGVPVINQ